MGMKKVNTVVSHFCDILNWRQFLMGSDNNVHVPKLNLKLCKCVDVS